MPGSTLAAPTTQVPSHRTRPRRHVGLRALLASLVAVSLLVVGTAPVDAQATSELALGDTGAAVENAQDLLNQFLALSVSTQALIAKDGVYGPNTKAAVEEFEQLADRSVDGVLTIADQGALTAIVEELEATILNFGRGAEGRSVQTWQSDLNNWARLTMSDLPIEDDGIFGPNTEAATRAFETASERQIDGIVEPIDRQVMRRILADLRSAAGDLPPFVLGSSGLLVQSAQSLLNTFIALADHDIGLLTEDGFYGRETRDTVLLFEDSEGLSVDGIMTRADFDGLRLVVAALEREAPASVLAEGDSGQAVRVWQDQISEWLRLSSIDLDPIRIDGVFGPSTTRATIAFQRRVGLQVDGVVEPEDRVALRDDLRRLREEALEGTVAGADNLGELVRADDFNLRDASILRLYYIFFDREPEFGGAKYWVERGRSGDTMRQIVREFAASPEFAARYGQPDDTAFVTLLYQNAFERDPDPAGLAYWLARLDGELDRPDIVTHFAFSPEFVAANPIGGV